MVIDNYKEESTSIKIEYYMNYDYESVNRKYFSYNYSDINQINFQDKYRIINIVQISNVKDKLISFDFKYFYEQFQLFEYDNDSEYIEDKEILTNLTNYKYYSKDYF